MLWRSPILAAAETPLNKVGLKSSMDNITTGHIIDVESGEESITKPVKLVYLNTKVCSC